MIANCRLQIAKCKVPGAAERARSAGIGEVLPFGRRTAPTIRARRTPNEHRTQNNRAQNTELPEVLHSAFCILHSAFDASCLLPLAFVVFLAFVPGLGARDIRLNDLKVPTQVIGETEYAPLVELVGYMGGNVWQVENKFIAILPPHDDNGYEIVFTQGQGIVLVNQQAVTLPVPFRFIDGEVYVPTALLNEIFPVKLTRMPQILSFSLAHMRDTSTLRIEADTMAYYTSISVTSTRFRIYLQADCKIAHLDPTGLISKVDFVQRNGTELDITTTQPCICRTAREGKGVTVKFAVRPTRRINTIVIDPGHGGKDPGANGKRLKEKDANLDIALRLSKRLKQVTTANIVLTRSRDEYVSLGDRTRMANSLQADLYVSIHCNAAPDAPNAQGLETYFLSSAQTDWERAVMSRENGALDFSVPDTNKAKAEVVGSILRDLAQNQYLKESQELAADVQSATTTWLRGKDRGVKQADFAVLRDAYMPSILVECGFVTNPDEEKLLSAGDFRERIATALSSGIMQFVNHVENVARKSGD